MEAFEANRTKGHLATLAIAMAVMSCAGDRVNFFKSSLVIVYSYLTQKRIDKMSPIQNSQAHSNQQLIPTQQEESTVSRAIRVTASTAGGVTVGMVSVFATLAAEVGTLTMIAAEARARPFPSVFTLPVIASALMIATNVTVVAIPIIVGVVMGKEVYDSISEAIQSRTNEKS